ncbi:MAG: DUF192 domain-containing protein [Salinibacter sp.]
MQSFDSSSFLVRHALPLALVCGVLLAGPTACGRSGDSAPAEAQSDTTTIPFTTEGRLAFIQNGDSTVTIDIEIADTDSARQRGMMQRESFPNDRSGMLFPFKKEEPQSFWMSNTPVALDIIFVSADSQIVNIAKYTTPFSNENYRSGEPAKFVIETPAGFADSHGILVGDRVRWRRLE